MQLRTWILTSGFDSGRARPPDSHRANPLAQFRHPRSTRREPAGLLAAGTRGAIGNDGDAASNPQARAARPGEGCAGR